MGASFFIDESGNTGTDWLNPAQPYFVYGGWLCLNNKKAEIESFLRDILATVQAPELKAKSLLRGKSGTYRFNQIFKKMITDFNALPFFGITDKKFMVAAKIVETFFDCAYNPAINGYLTYPVELKKALAACIVKDEKLIENFSRLISNCTLSIAEMKDINQQLIKLFVVQDKQIVANSIKNLSENNFSEMVDEFETVTRLGTRKSYITLTSTMLIELLKNIEFFCNDLHLNVDVYHDNLRGYDELFQMLRDTFLKDSAPVILGTKERPFLTNFPHIKSLNMVESKNELIVQASDLLCGFISKSFQTINTGEFLDENSQEIFHYLVGMYDELIEDNVKLWNWYASYEFEKNFFSALNPNKEFSETDYHNIVNRDFHKALK